MHVSSSDEEIKSVFEAAEAHLPNGSTAEALLADIEVARQPYVLVGLRGYKLVCFSSREYLAHPPKLSGSV